MSNKKYQMKKVLKKRECLKCNIFIKMQKHDKMYKQENESIFFHLNLA